MSEELRPCPFCGGTKICTEKGINLNYCDNCSAESNVEHWNIRPIEDALNARIAELDAEVTKGHELQDAYCDRIAELEALVNVSEGLYERIYEQAARIAELEGKIASLKDKHYEMANELEGKRFFTDTLFYDIYRLQSRIAEFEARAEKAEAFIDRLVEAGRMMKQPETIEEFHRGRRDYNALVAEFEAEIDQLTADSTDERKDDKSPNDTQSSTIVYGKESE